MTILWILYAICWIFTIIVVILIATVNKEKHTVWAKTDYGIVFDHNQLKGVEWIVAIWGIIAGLVSFFLIRLCSNTELENLKSTRITYTVFFLLVWIMINVLAIVCYRDESNPSGDPKKRPVTKWPSTPLKWP